MAKTIYVVAAPGRRIGRGGGRGGSITPGKAAIALAAIVTMVAVGKNAAHDGAAGTAAGQQPATAAVVTGGGHKAAAVRDTSARIPYLGTTLPPESTMVRWFGPLGSASHETQVPFAGHTVQINKALAVNLRELGAKLAAAGYSGYIRDVGGFRDSVGASGSPIPFSMHQFGAAFDINEDGGPDGAWNTMTLPAHLVAIAASMGWFCGQSWGGSSRDGGHFQFAGGLK